MCSDLQYLDHGRVALVPACLWLIGGGAESRSVMSLQNASRRRGAIEGTLQVKGHDTVSCGCGNGVMAFDLQRPFDGTAPPRSILEAHHRTTLGPAADQPETSGHQGDPPMVQILQVRAHDTVLVPHRPAESGAATCGSTDRR